MGGAVAVVGGGAVVDGAVEEVDAVVDVVVGFFVVVGGSSDAGTCVVGADSESETVWLGVGSCTTSATAVATISATRPTNAARARDE